MQNLLHSTWYNLQHDLLKQFLCYYHCQMFTNHLPIWPNGNFLPIGFTNHQFSNGIRKLTNSCQWFTIGSYWQWYMGCHQSNHHEQHLKLTLAVGGDFAEAYLCFLLFTSVKNAQAIECWWWWCFSHKLQTWFHDKHYLLYYPHISVFSFHTFVVLLYQLLRKGTQKEH